MEPKFEKGNKKRNMKVNINPTQVTENKLIKQKPRKESVLPWIDRD